VRQPPLADAAATAASRAPEPATVAAVAQALARVLGADRLSTVEAARRAASTDFAHLSPILPTALPQRPADLVVRPRTADDVVATVQLAHEHRVPVTPRGAGTGNYGQAVPLAGGVVVDLTRCDTIIGIGDGWIRAEAGATFVALEAAARRTGQEIAIMPTTVGSTIGGFLAGGAGGVGSIEHGWLWDGYVLELEVVPCPPGTASLTVDAAGCLPYLHAYGVTGVLTTVTVRLGPARERVAALASFPAGSHADAVQAGLALLRLEPPPRLVSLDEPGIVATYQPDDAMPLGRHSLRAVVDVSTVGSFRTIVAEHSGRVEAIRPSGNAYLTSLAFNHVTLRARRARPELCHLQVSGTALVQRPDDIRAAVPGALLHLDGMRTTPDPHDPAAQRQFGGLLLAPFRDASTLYAGAARLTELGVHVVDPHTWLLGGPALPGIRTTAEANDPAGLLNPGKLPPIPAG
jgi:FAD/FMN-containing dehydrogenase